MVDSSGKSLSQIREKWKRENITVHQKSTRDKTEKKKKNKKSPIGIRKNCVGQEKWWKLF